MTAGRVAGKIALVTGAGRGIGRAIARMLGHEGASVVTADLDLKQAELTAQAIMEGGGSAMALGVDVTDPASTEAMAAGAVAREGGLDILCSNVGIYPVVPLLEMTVTEWERVISVNLTGGFLTLRACLPYLVATGAGRVVFTSSITGNRTAVPAMAHYAASKAGINGLIRSAAVELASYGVTVNGVEPGTVMTQGLVELGQDFIDRTSRGVPLGRLATPEDVAHAVLYLASDESAYVTGQTIVVDGGQVLPESGMTAP